MASRTRVELLAVESPPPCVLTGRFRGTSPLSPNLSRSDARPSPGPTRACCRVSRSSLGPLPWDRKPQRRCDGECRLTTVDAVVTYIYTSTGRSCVVWPSSCSRELRACLYVVLLTSDHAMARLLGTLRSVVLPLLLKRPGESFLHRWRERLVLRQSCLMSLDHVAL